MEETLTNFEEFSNGWLPYIVAIIVGVIVMIRTYMGGTECPSRNRIPEKIALITGASSGIGFETAKQLAERGAKVIITSRNLRRAEIACDLIKRKINGAQLEPLELDVSEMSNIVAFSKSITKLYDRLDILINNAGVISQFKSFTDEGNETMLATNYLGPFLLTHLLLPLLKKSENGRVINISTLAHYGTDLNVDDLMINSDSLIDFQPRDTFVQSKLALILFTRHMATVHKTSSVTFNVLSPGIVRNTDHLKNTSMNSSFFKKISVWPWVWLFLKTPHQGSQTVVYLAVERQLSQQSGKYFSDCEIKEPSDTAKNEKLATKLYQKTLDLMKDYIQ